RVRNAQRGRPETCLALDEREPSDIHAGRPRARRCARGAVEGMGKSKPSEENNSSGAIVLVLPLRRRLVREVGRGEVRPGCPKARARSARDKFQAGRARPRERGNPAPAGRRRRGACSLATFFWRGKGT